MKKEGHQLCARTRKSPEGKLSWPTLPCQDGRRDHYLYAAPAAVFGYYYRVKGEVMNWGGLHIVVRNAAIPPYRQQLRGYCARQGTGSHPGYLSLEDDLGGCLVPDNISGIMDSWEWKKDEPIDTSWLF